MCRFPPECLSRPSSLRLPTSTPTPATAPSTAVVKAKMAGQLFGLCGTGGLCKARGRTLARSISSSTALELRRVAGSPLRPMRAVEPQQRGATQAPDVSRPRRAASKTRCIRDALHPMRTRQCGKTICSAEPSVRCGLRTRVDVAVHGRAIIAWRLGPCSTTRARVCPCAQIRS